MGVYPLWHNDGFAVGAVMAGVVAESWGLCAAVWVVAGTTAVSGG
jgi:hypothetical protein